MKKTKAKTSDFREKATKPERPGKEAPSSDYPMMTTMALGAKPNP